MGQVCEKHEEFYEEVCRWCEPAKAVEAPLAPVPISAQWGGNLNNQAAAQQNQASSIAAQNSYCACKKFFLGPPFRYFDGLREHTPTYCKLGRLP